jgi:hypothetical protein
MPAERVGPQPGGHRSDMRCSQGKPSSIFLSLKGTASRDRIFKFFDKNELF